MKLSIQNKLESLLERHEELSHLLSNPDVIRDQIRFRSLSKEYAELEPLVVEFRSYQEAESGLQAVILMLKDPDAEIRKMAEEELKDAKLQVESKEEKLHQLLLPKDPNDHRNIFLEIRAGTGGDEAALFSGDLFRMYSRFSENQGWGVELISESYGEHGRLHDLH